MTSNTRKLNLRILELDFLESAILKTHIMDFSQLQTQKFLEIDAVKYHMIINNLLYKYNSIDLFQSVLYAINNGQIDRYDLVKDEIKKLALTYSGHIYEFLKQEDYIDTKKNIILDLLLKDFITKCFKVFIDEQSLATSLELSVEEMNYCKLRISSFSGINSKQINQLIRANKSIEKELMIKLKVNNFFNVIRRCFELQLLDKNLFFKDHNDFNKSIRKDTKDRIISINLMKKIPIKERTLYIYFDLIQYYNKLEDVLFITPK